MAETLRKIPVIFYRSPSGAETVLDWLRGLDQADRAIIGRDLMRVQFRWPVGMPICRPLGDGLWELRSTLERGAAARLLFAPVRGTLLILHGFIKKTPKAPRRDIELARRRYREFEAGRDGAG